MVNLVNKIDKALCNFIITKTKDRASLIRLFAVSGKILTAVFFAIYTAACIYILFNTPENILPFLLVPLACLIFARLLRFAIKRERPVSTDGVNKQSYSFPSNHAASAAVISLGLFKLSPALGIIMLIISVITGIQRIICGRHYLSDVLAGWAIGALFGILLLSGVLGFL